MSKESAGRSESFPVYMPRPLLDTVDRYVKEVFSSRRWKFINNATQNRREISGMQMEQQDLGNSRTVYVRNDPISQLGDYNSSIKKKISVAFPDQELEKIRESAKERDESVNAYINKATALQVVIFSMFEPQQLLQIRETGLSVQVGSENILLPYQIL